MLKSPDGENCPYCGGELEPSSQTVELHDGSNQTEMVSSCTNCSYSYP